MNKQLYQLLPELDTQEFNAINQLANDYDEQKTLMFANLYRSRRREPQLILFATLAGFVVIAGIQRLITDQIGMGILYLLTGGLCFIGTIIDLINYKQIAFEYNIKIANEIHLSLSKI